MLLLKWLWFENGGDGDIPPVAVFYTLRVLMFALSFVLEDWALHELIHSPRQRRIAVILVASSYVTWTYQTHTFSNSIETLLVIWSLVLIQRIVENKVRPPLHLQRTYLTCIESTPAFLNCGISCSCLCRCCRDIQPHYFPSLPCHPWHPTDTSCH